MDSSHHQLNWRFLVYVLDIRMGRDSLLDDRVGSLVQLPGRPYRCLHLTRLTHLKRVSHAGHRILRHRRADRRSPIVIIGHQFGDVLPFRGQVSRTRSPRSIKRLTHD